MKRQAGYRCMKGISIFFFLVLWSCASGPDVNPTEQAGKDLILEVDAAIERAKAAGADEHTPGELRIADQRLDFSRRLMDQGKYDDAMLSARKALDKVRIAEAIAVMKETEKEARKKENEAQRALEDFRQLEEEYKALLSEP